jgi:hypothetical protein
MLSSDYWEDEQGGVLFLFLICLLTITASSLSPYKPSGLIFTDDCYWVEGYVVDKYYETGYLTTDYYIVFNGTANNETDFEGSVYTTFPTYFITPVGYHIEGGEFCEVQTVREWIQSGNLTLTLVE